MSSPASTSTNPGPATVTGNDYLGGGTPLRIGTSTTDVVGFYGVTPVAQRAVTSVQLTSNLATTTTTPTSAQYNAAIAALSEVMNTLSALGIWAGS